MQGGSDRILKTPVEFITVEYENEYSSSPGFLIFSRMSNMKKIFSIASCLLLILAAEIASQTKPKTLRPDGNKALEHVKFLASDAMRGRKSATPEYRQAAEYVAAKMKEYGLRPGGENGTWFQEVPFKNWTDFEQPLRLEILSPQHRIYFPGRGRDFIPLNGTGSGISKGPLIFAGYGVVSEKSKWNDFDGLDPKGKILLLLPDSPPILDEGEKKEWSLEKKITLAQEKGAIGIIEMDLSEPGQLPVHRLASSLLKPGTCPRDFVVLRAGRHFLDDVFYISKKSWKDLVSKTLRLKKSQTASLDASVEMEAHFIQEDRKSVNVIGVLPGSDPKLKGEIIMMGGHLDHLGVGLDGFIYPGADDNAGSAAVSLETSRALIAGGFKPARTLVFTAWAGEEIGAVGSRYYTQHPLFPLDKTVLYMNIDMVGTGDSDLYVGGMYEYGQLYDLIKAKMDPETKQKLRYRLNYRGSDHTSFWDKGVASISLRTGNILTRSLDDEHPEYHYPGDRPELIDPELLRIAAQYHYDILMNLANSKENLLDPKFRVEFIHKDAAIVDMHCDTIGRAMNGEDLRQDLEKGHIDIPKLKRGAVDLQVFACYVPVPANDLEKSQAAKKAFDQIDACHKLAAENPDDLDIVLSYEDFQKIRNNGKTGMLIGIEGGYAIENDLSLLRSFYREGVRLMTLTHWNRTDWADASGDAKAELGGLTEFGESVIKEMNRLGMIIDVSHAHDETFWDVIRISSVPIVASHSCCRALANHHRNMSDDMLKALAKNGGVIGINFSPGFLNAENDKKLSDLAAEIAKKHGLPEDYREIMKAEPDKRDKYLAEFKVKSDQLKKSLPPVDVKTVVDHIDHVVKITGNADHVGLGSDFDGISDTPVGLENAGRLMNITKELMSRGYKEEDIRKILGGNFLRVFEAVGRATVKK
jgi:membrane dipeptidase